MPSISFFYVVTTSLDKWAILWPELHAFLQNDPDSPGGRVPWVLGAGCGGDKCVLFQIKQEKQVCPSE